MKRAGDIAEMEALGSGSSVAWSVGENKHRGNVSLSLPCRPCVGVMAAPPEEMQWFCPKCASKKKDKKHKKRKHRAH